MFYSWFLQLVFLAQVSKFDFWVADWVRAVKSKHFRDFLKTSSFPKILF